MYVWIMYIAAQIALTITSNYYPLVNRALDFLDSIQDIVV